jgi:hypothetical protein
MHRRLTAIQRAVGGDQRCTIVGKERRRKRTGACPDSEVEAVLERLSQGLAAAKDDPDQDRTWADDLPDLPDLDDGHTAVLFLPREKVTTKKVGAQSSSRPHRTRSDRKRRSSQAV